MRSGDAEGILRLIVQRQTNSAARHIDAEHRLSSRKQQRSNFAAEAICTHTDHTAAAEGGDDGSFLISHQQNALQGEASRGVFNLHTNKKTKVIRPSAGGSLLHLLNRRQRSEADRRGRRR